VSGRLEAGDFGGHWPGRLAFDIEWRLTAGALVLRVTAENVGDTETPVGIGWHPYFNLPSGDRGSARLRVPAGERVVVNNYDEVLPIGRLDPVAGTVFDFDAAEPLGDRYLDDCFTALRRDAGQAFAEVLDPGADLRLRIGSPSPAASAFQVYAPPDQSFVVVEPQFNLADPFGAEWPQGLDTGMAWLKPGEKTSYEARVQAFALGTP
jgi:galactose mutarotase-like enzyme